MPHANGAHTVTENAEAMCEEAGFSRSAPAYPIRGVQPTRDRGRPFNNKNLTVALRSGLSQTVRNRILNWDLG